MPWTVWIRSPLNCLCFGELVDIDSASSIKENLWVEPNLKQSPYQKRKCFGLITRFFPLVASDKQQTGRLYLLSKILRFPATASDGP